MRKSAELMQSPIKKVIADVRHQKRVTHMQTGRTRTHGVAHTTMLLSFFPVCFSSLLLQKFNIELLGGDLVKLRNLDWLSDQTINFYVEMLGERQKRNQASRSGQRDGKRRGPTMTHHNTHPPYPFLHLSMSLSFFRSRPVPSHVLPSQQCRIHYFNTFFYKKLSPDARTYVYKDVSRWTRRAKVDVLKLDKIVVPVHVHGNHWCLAIINMRDRRFEYFDSLGGTNPTCLKHLRQFVVDEVRAYHPTEVAAIGIDEWTDVMRTDVPQQNNGSDCGVFTLKFADYASENRPFLFTHKSDYHTHACTHTRSTHARESRTHRAHLCLVLPIRT